jgi:vacuolar-type H+-ATPase subunit E/Vma4
MTINNARQELKARKKLLKEFISKLNEKVKQDLLNEDEAKAQVDSQIKTNLQDIKGLSDSI